MDISFENNLSLVWYLLSVHRPSTFFFKSLLVLQFSLDCFETRYNYSLGQSSHLVLIATSTVLVDSLKLGTVILWVNLHILF